MSQPLNLQAQSPLSQISKLASNLAHSVFRVRHVATGNWVGQAAHSRLGFPVPLSQCQLSPVKLVFIAAGKPTAEGAPFRIQSAEHHLKRMDHFFHATDITLPSIIYRDFSIAIDPRAYTFLVKRQPSKNKKHIVTIQSTITGEYMTVDQKCGRLVWARFPSKGTLFQLA